MSSDFFSITQINDFPKEWKKILSRILEMGTKKFQILILAPKFDLLFPVIFESKLKIKPIESKYFNCTIHISNLEIIFNKSFLLYLLKWPTSLSKFENKICYGSSFEVTDKYKYRSLETGLYNLSMIKNLYENKFQFTPNIINKLYGNESLSNYLDNGTPSDEIEAGKYLFNFLAKERKDIEKFIKKSSKYFLYD